MIHEACMPVYRCPDFHFTILALFISHSHYAESNFNTMSSAHSSQTTVGTDAQARCSGSDQRVTTVDLGISNTSGTLFAFLPEKLLFGNVGGHSSHPVHIYLHCFAWRGALDGFDGCPSK